MLLRIVCAMAAFALAACVSTYDIKPSTPKFRLNGISQGKMRLADGRWMIYEKTGDMDYEVNDRCTYNRQPIDCMRHGFAIDYDAGGQDVRLSCIARANVTVRAGNIAEA